MGDDKDFQKRVQKIGQLVHDLETIADPASRAAAKELVQLLMDLHGAGLEQILDIVYQSGDSGARVIDELGQDSLVSSLLVLYNLHPDDVQTRVERKLKQMVSKLHKLGAEATLTSVSDGNVRHSCQHKRTCLRFHVPHCASDHRRSHLRCRARLELSGHRRPRRATRLWIRCRGITSRCSQFISSSTVGRSGKRRHGLKSESIKPTEP